MQTTTYPGVYIVEVPSGVRTITGVATSITAFIGRALRGPVDEPKIINSFADFERIFGGLWALSAMSFAVRDFYLNGGSQAVIVRVHNGAVTAFAGLLTGEASPNDVLQLDAGSPGTWGTKLQVSIVHPALARVDQFNLIIEELDEKTGKVIATETHLNVSVNEQDARFLPRVLEQNSSLVQIPKDTTGKYIMPNVRPLVVNKVKLSALQSPPGSPPASPVVGIDLDGLTLTDVQVLGSRNAKTGLYALEKTDLFNLLCIPPYLQTDDVGDVIDDAAAYCEERRAMLIVDPPTAWSDKDKARDGINAGIGTTSKNAAIFFPRIKQANPLRESQIEIFVPCGAVAGIFARTDAQRGVWKAPAGLDATLIGVPQLTVSLTDEENGELNQLGVNCLRSFPIFGRVVWGSRTLEGADQRASEWKYIPVRRVALFIEESLYRGTQWVVFEPNDEPLWAQIRLNIGAFMQNLFRQGAFQGKSPREAYFVKCDKETTTQNDINLGTVNILVGFAPLKPAEFVIIKIQQMAGQIEV